MQARIFKPARNAMQSGRARTKRWVLEFEPLAAKRPDPLMGWAGSNDTLDQVRLHFSTLDEAKAYADKHGIEARVEEARERPLKLQAYADNFR